MADRCTRRMQYSRHRTKINAQDLVLLQIAHRREPPFAPKGSWEHRKQAEGPDAVSALRDGSFNMMRSLQAPGNNPTEQSTSWRGRNNSFHHGHHGLAPT